MAAKSILAAYRRLARTQRALVIMEAKTRHYREAVADAQQAVAVAEAEARALKKEVTDGDEG